jgi:hypothetical protein
MSPMVSRLARTTMLQHRPGRAISIEVAPGDHKNAWSSESVIDRFGFWDTTDDETFCFNLSRRYD